VRFKDNWMEVTSGEDQVLRTDDAWKTRLGPAGSTLGGNGLMVVDQDVDFVQENDPDPNDTVVAEHSYWWLYNTATGQRRFLDDVIQDGWEIQNRLSPVGAKIDFNPLRSDTTSAPSCWTGSPPTGGAAALPVRQAVLDGAPDRDAPGSGEALDAVSLDVPEETHLGVLGSGFPGPILFEVGIAQGDEGRCVVEVFDVRGRRVARLLDGALTPGTYRVAWDARVASGIYFTRMEGAAKVLTRKVVVLR
jgi:hypothetical protein